MEYSCLEDLNEIIESINALAHSFSREISDKPNKISRDWAIDKLGANFIDTVWMQWEH